MLDTRHKNLVIDASLSDIGNEAREVVYHGERMTPTDRLERAKKIVQDYKENRMFVYEIAKRHGVASGTARLYIQRDLKGLPLLGWTTLIDSDMRQSIIDDYFGLAKPQMIELAAEYDVNKQQVSRIIKAEKLRRAAEGTATKMPIVPDHAGNQNGAADNVVPEGETECTRYYISTEDVNTTRKLGEPT